MDKTNSAGPSISRREFFLSLFSGATSSDGPLLAVINNARCSMGQGQSCDRCAKICPTSPKAVTVSVLGLSAGVNAALCTGCGQCAKVCPAEAITMKAALR